jgi:hypothetical protein
VHAVEARSASRYGRWFAEDWQLANLEGVTTDVLLEDMPCVNSLVTWKNGYLMGEFTVLTRF